LAPGLNLTSSVFVAKIRESPDVSEADGNGYAGEEEVQLVAPLASAGVILEAGLLKHQNGFFEQKAQFPS
jgi:hypothetical protein